MAYKITTDCISCGSCKMECPNGAISEGNEIYRIDPACCTECVGFNSKSKCDEVCPMDACVLDDDHKESNSDLFVKWNKLHPGKIYTISLCPRG